MLFLTPEHARSIYASTCRIQGEGTPERALARQTLTAAKIHALITREAANGATVTPEQADALADVLQGVAK